jgi:hypothetical protein
VFGGQVWEDEVAVPSVIKIGRDEGSHTDQIGHCADGRQFMAFVTATVSMPPPEDWSSQKRWYAVLHRFTPEGDHIGTETFFAGTAADGERSVIQVAEKRLADMIAALGQVTYGDVSVALFQVKVDGNVFGLVDESEPEEEYEAVHLLPNDFVFFDPWDGTYDT